MLPIFFRVRISPVSSRFGAGPDARRRQAHEGMDHRSGGMFDVADAGTGPGAADCGRHSTASGQRVRRDRRCVAAAAARCAARRRARARARRPARRGDLSQGEAAQDPARRAPSTRTCATASIGSAARLAATRRPRRLRLRAGPRSTNGSARRRFLSAPSSMCGCSRA